MKPTGWQRILLGCLGHSWSIVIRSPQRPEGAEAGEWGNWGTFADVRPRVCGICVRRVARRWSPDLGAARLLVDCERWAHGCSRSPSDVLTHC